METLEIKRDKNTEIVVRKGSLLLAEQHIISRCTYWGFQSSRNSITSYQDLLNAAFSRESRSACEVVPVIILVIFLLSKIQSSLFETAQDHLQ